MSEDHVALSESGNSFLLLVDSLQTVQLVLFKLFFLLFFNLLLLACNHQFLCFVLFVNSGFVV